MCALNQISPYGQEGGTGGGGSGPIFFSAMQQCTVTCPDGLPFTYTVPAGAFAGTSQQAANTAANTFACQQAATRSICLSGIAPNFYTVGNAFTGTITATGGSLASGSNTNKWQLIGGSLPPGLTFNGGNLTGNTATITGTPTQTGLFSFIIQITDPLGDQMTKTFSLGSCGANSAVLTSNMPSNANTRYDIYTAVPPVPGYTTQYEAFSNGFQTMTTTWTFTTPQPFTWNYQLGYTAGGAANNYLRMFVNGVLVQDFEDVAAGSASVNGSFMTTACAPTTVEITYSLPPAGSTMNSYFAWQDPPGFCPTIAVNPTASVGEAWFPGTAGNGNPPLPGYDTEYAIGTNTSGQTLQLVFQSATPKTWNWLQNFAGGVSQPTFTINGTLFPGNETGTFTTGPCGNNVTVNLTAFGTGGNAQTVRFNFLTPS